MYSLFENLVNYDICQAVDGRRRIVDGFENLVNYDICQARCERDSARCSLRTL